MIIFLVHLGEIASVDQPLDLLQSRLDRLIRTAVSLGPLHAYGMLFGIQQISKNLLAIQQGPVYPALDRLDHPGRITSEWDESKNNRTAKYYRLTAAGMRRLQTEVENRIADVIPGTTPEEV